MRRQLRRGTATVEFAICLPLLLILFVGTMDACTRVALQQSLEVTVYEGSRVAGAKTSTTADVVSRCQAILAQRGIEGATITTTPSEVASSAPGEIVIVEVSVECETAGTFLGPLVRGRQATARFACMRQMRL
jgi:Flp pilus assembly protein TadG